MGGGGYGGFGNQRIDGYRPGGGGGLGGGGMWSGAGERAQTDDRNQGQEGYNPYGGGYGSAGIGNKMMPYGGQMSDQARTMMWQTPYDQAQMLPYSPYGGQIPGRQDGNPYSYGGYGNKVGYGGGQNGYGGMQSLMQAMMGPQWAQQQQIRNMQMSPAQTTQIPQQQNQTQSYQPPDYSNGGY